MKEHIAKERKLEFNEKTQIMPISQGVDYLGFHFYLNDTGKVIRRLRTKNKVRMKRKLKRMKRAYACNKLQLEDIKRSLASYNGHLSHGHTYRLRKNISRSFILQRKEREDGVDKEQEIQQNDNRRSAADHDSLAVAGRAHGG